jgi:hypothetical protein
MRGVAAVGLLGVGLLAARGAVAAPPAAQGFVSAQKVPAGKYRRVFGGDHGCALAVDGKIACWSDGRSSHALSIPPGPHKDLVWDGSGGCAIAQGGAMHCFGTGRFDTPVAVKGAFKRVAVSLGTACGLREDGSIACGANRHWAAKDIPKGHFVDLSCGAHVCCGLDASGTAKCWGEDERLRQPPAVALTSIDCAANEVACGLDRSQKVVCWGNVERRRVPPPGRFESMSTGSTESCAVATDGTATCWGDSHAAAVTLPVKLDPSRAPARGCGIGPAQEIVCWGRDWFGPIPGGAFSAIDGGKDSICGIRPNGELVCFGREEGIVPAAPRGTFAEVSVGSWHACARRVDGTLACWGNNFEDSLQAPAGVWSAVSVDVASCALARDGAATCWGKRAGDGFKERLRKISSGGAFACGLTQAGKVACIDADPFLAGRSREPLPRGDDFTDVMAGYEHVCAIHKGGAAACWGRDVWEETHPPGAARFSALALGEKRSCGLTLDGAAVCWGGSPRTPPAGPFRALAITGNTAQDDPTFVCAIRTADGALACWAY